MNNGTIAKYELLKKQLEKLGSIVVGLSGGVDSSLLAKISHDVLGDKAIAVTIISPLIPSWDLKDAKSITSQTGMEHIFIEEDMLHATVSQNMENRCYHCKKATFGTIIRIAKERGFNAVADGSNVDDKNDYRPGEQAMEELKILSPLKMAGLTKTEIRELSKQFGLPTWDKPAYACLGSRIPYGDEITPAKLSKIEKAETYLHSLGYFDVRVRNHGDIARIELIPDDMRRFCKHETMSKVSQQLKKYGFLYVCMELEGYTMGSLNRKIK